MSLDWRPLNDGRYQATEGPATAEITPFRGGWAIQCTVLGKSVYGFRDTVDGAKRYAEGKLDDAVVELTD